MRASQILGTIAWMTVAACTHFATARIISHGLSGADIKTSAPQESKKPATVTPAAVASGAELYERFCTECHGPNGEGDGPVADSLDGPRPANLRRAAKRYSDDELYARITYGAKDMPTWGEFMTDEEIWNVVYHVESFDPL